MINTGVGGGPATPSRHRVEAVYWNGMIYRSGCLPRVITAAILSLGDRTGCNKSMLMGKKSPNTFKFRDRCTRSVFGYWKFLEFFYIGAEEGSGIDVERMLFII